MLVTILKDDGYAQQYLEFMQEGLFKTPYWVLVFVCGLVWFLGILPAFKDSDMMRLFRGIAGLMFIILIMLYLLVTYWI